MTPAEKQEMKDYLTEFARGVVRTIVREVIAEAIGKAELVTVKPRSRTPIPDLLCDRTFYIHRGPSGTVAVKTAALFMAQGGLTQKWGQVWHCIYADSIEHARRIGRGYSTTQWKACPECGGWGHPTGCSMCHISCMGG